MSAIRVSDRDSEEEEVLESDELSNDQQSLIDDPDGEELEEEERNEIANEFLNNIRCPLCQMMVNIGNSSS